MPKYVYRCPADHNFSLVRSIERRDVLALCPEHPLWPCPRDVAAELATQYLPPKLDQNQWTSWYDVHDKSPRELAHDPTIERYDPDMAHKSKAHDGPTYDDLKRIWDSADRQELERLSAQLEKEPYCA